MMVNARYEWLLAACLLTAGLLFSGCKDDAPSKGNETSCTFNDDCEDGLCIAGECRSNTDATDSEDVDTSDTTDTDDGETVDQCLSANERPFECACESDDQCSSGRCFAAIGGNVCSKICNGNADCGSGPEYQCVVPSGSGGDQTNLCVPLLAELCRPCASADQCSNDSVCYEFFDASNCLIPCDDNSDCPETYTCDSDTAPGGEQVCVPDLFTCSDCYDPDFDGAGEGPGCTAADCDQDDASIFEGAVDICDGKDNDCDGTTDQDFVDADGLYTVDVTHCGACGIDCNDQSNNPNVADSFCDAGVCGINACKAGFQDCSAADAGCETALSDPRNCGSCGTDCIALSTGTTNYTCSEQDGGGFDCEISACEGSFADCTGDGLCDSDLNADTTCGTCVTNCEVLPNTADGVCEVTGSGVDIQRSCAVGTCDEGYCDHDSATPGCEDPLTNARFCGATDCSTPTDCTDKDVVQNVAGAFCDVGVCNFDSCSNQYADCNADPSDGCESDIRYAETCTSGCFDCNSLPNDPSANVSSLAGAQCNPNTGCLFNCEPDYGNCDGDFTTGCESSLEGIASCGSCNNDCTRRFDNASGSCGGSPPLNDVKGGCGLGVCDEGFVDLDGLVATGCECSQGASDQPDFDGPAGTGTDTNCDSVDGDAISSVFVSTSGTDNATCGVFGDLNGDGTTNIPLNSAGDGYDFSNENFSRSQLAAPWACKTIAQGMVRAAELGLEQVLVTTGKFTQDAAGLVIAGPVRIYGGYSENFKSRSLDSQTVVDTNSARRLVRITNVADQPVVLSGLRLQGLKLNPGAASSSANYGRGQSVYTLVIENSVNVVVEDSLVSGGTGQGGEGGDDGGHGANGGTGSRAGNGSTAGTACFQTSVPTVPGGYGGPGGSQGCGFAGGRGGNGASTNGNDGTGGAGAGGGGAGGGPTRGGSAGENGSTGANGNGGAGGSSRNGVLSGQEVVANNGASGAAGTSGRGGGGGGGGGSTGTWAVGCFSLASGSGGGGGGGGGCGGSPSEAGYGGGAAVAVMLINSQADLSRSKIEMGVGGDGGSGGRGGNGGVGGAGGNGGVYVAGPAGEQGGAGGNGGSGGAAGGAGGAGGGAGGPAIGIALIGSSSQGPSDPTFVRCGTGYCGGGGAGGAGGSGGRQNGNGAQASSGASGTSGALETQVSY